MLSFFKKLFRKPDPAPVVRALAPAVPDPAVSNMPAVEVAHLSLSAILSRFPEDLRATIQQAPPETATVALPVPTILKQLSSGTVKMSLASLLRQAPAGMCSPLKSEDKRMVEVPLAEVFRHVKPRSLKRRADQRVVATPEIGFNLFGNSANPYEIVPSAPAESLASELLKPAVAVPAFSRLLKMESLAPEPGISHGEEMELPLALEAQPPGERMLAPPPEFAVRTTPLETKPASEPPIVIQLSPLIEQWPEPLRKELAALNGEAKIALPHAEISSGLAQGKLVFSWGQVRGWIQPAQAALGSVNDTTSLTLPLKQVAPAFLLATKRVKPEHTPIAIDESIPALFSDGRTPPPPVMPEQSAPVLSSPEAKRKDARQPTIGDVFGQPDKHDWTPPEIVENTAQLPGVSGAIVALQEGLQVAHSLPEGVKSEVVAAFLPQIFGRLNQYAGEMQLGEVDDLLFTTHGAHCQIYRLGFLYFAILGKAGEALPWPALRLIAEELRRQTQN